MSGSFRCGLIAALWSASSIVGGCGGSHTATPPSGDPDGGSPDAATPACTTSTDCDDGVACTIDSCSKGRCANTPNDGSCEDLGPCKASTCTSTGCESENVQNGTTCTDPVSGNTGMCVAGACSTSCVADAQCDDGIDCTVDTCDTDTGVCNAPTFDDSVCDDGMSCTVDACAATGCTNALAPDDTACTIAGGAAGTCNAGVCVTGCTGDAECDDGIDCTVDACDTSTGACSSVPDNTMCDDGVPCTADACSAATGCVATPQNSQCDDGIACTTDACDATAGCQFTVQDALCDDGVGCTTDACSAATGCSHAPGAASCDDDNPCTADVCDVTGDCGSTPVMDGAGCADGAGANGLCAAGNCVVQCDANADCDDGNACNGVETCNLGNGTCAAGTPPTCNDGVACTSDSCDPATGCAPAPGAARCDDGNPCTVGSCDAGTGCAQNAVGDTTACTVPAGSGQCQSGTCVVGCASDGECNDGHDCTADSCDLGTGSCVNTPNDGACNDGVSCTTDSCNPTMGCQSTPDDGACDDGNPCTANSCDVSGGCTSTNVMNGTICQDGSGDNGQCSAGSCVVGCTSNGDCDNADVCDGAETCNLANGTCVGGTPLSCNDGIPCTTDSCDPVAGCQSVADDTACDDSIDCTTDACVVGTGCQSTTDATSCEDGNECTTNVCSATTGCGSTNVIDGTPCATGTCSAGVCSAAHRGVIRFNSLALEDPHTILDKKALGFVQLCGDITWDPMTIPIIGGEIPGLNPTFATLVTTDGDDADAFLDYSYVLAFDDLVQTNGAMGTGQAVQSDCTNMTTCTPTDGGQQITAGYTVKRTGTCMPAAAADLDPVTWKDGRVSALNQPTAGANGCFFTEPVTFTLELVLQGAPVVIQLDDTVIAGSFNADPATGINNGVLIGWLPESRAQMININVTDPISLTVNLAEDVLPDGDSCPAHDGRDMHNGVSGWWFMVNLSGASIASDVDSYFP